MATATSPARSDSSAPTGRDDVPSGTGDGTPGGGAAQSGGGALRRVAGLLAAPLLLAVVVQNLANVGFHGVVGRFLDPGQYGALGAVLAVMVLLSVPLTALQAAASAQVSQSGWDRRSIRITLRRSVLGAVVAAGLVALAAPAVRDFFHLGSPADALVLAPFVAVSIVLAVARGLLLGAGSVGIVAGTYLWGTAARLVAGLALLIPWGVTGALVGTLVGEGVALAAALWPALRRGGDADTASALGLRSVALSAVAVTGLFLFSTSDLLLARHFLAEADTGAYIAAATIAKTVLALPAAAMSVYYPRLVAAWSSPRPAATLRNAVLVVGGLAVLAGATIAALPGVALAVLYGPDAFPAAAGLVRMLGIIAALTGVISVLTYAALARRSASLLVPWAGAVLEVTLIVWRHESPLDVAQGSILALVPTLLVLVAWEGRAWLRGGRVVAGAAS